MEAYLDNAATTQVYPEVAELMVRLMREDYGNPSSKHTKGMEAERYITAAREIISKSLKCEPSELIFTSGGTESNNLALIGTALAHQRVGKHLITTRIEHASVLEPMLWLEKQGFEVTYLPVDENGRVQAEELEKAIREDTILVSVMMVNNEIGAWEDIKKLAETAKKKKPELVFHADGIQAYGKYKVIPKRLGLDLFSVSGHKLHGPKGSGFLYVKKGTKLQPILFGGGQQRGFRSGTENVPAIAGLGEAIRLFSQDREQKLAKMYRLKQTLIEGLLRLEGVQINGYRDIELEATAPHIVNACFEGIRAEVFLHALAAKGVYVSSGSACSSNHPELSGTLQAIGVEDTLLDSALRFSFSTMTTSEEIEYALQVLNEELPVLRRFTRK